MRKSVRQGRGAAIIKQLPHFYQSGDYENLLHGFVEIFGQMADAAEEDLLKVMRAHWVKTADNEGSSGFDTTAKGDLDKIFTLFLESLGGTNSLRQIDRQDPADDELYRNRILGLIQVLLNGPSTKAGIRAVVAANLGIFGKALDDDPEVRDKIQVIEYLPKTVGAGAGANLKLTLFGNLRPGDTNNYIRVENHNPIAVEMRLTLTLYATSQVLHGYAIRNLRVIDAASGTTWASFEGPLETGDVITFLPDGSIQLKTKTVAPPGNRRPRLQENATTRFYVSADFFEGSVKLFHGDILHPVGRFDETTFFKTDLPQPVFDIPDALFKCEYRLTLLTPATFGVQINWDIGDYTKPFDKPGDNTRGLIRYIVDKVKAAGVYAEINFNKDKGLQETHNQTEDFTIVLTKL